MTPLEADIQKKVEEPKNPITQVWAQRLLVGGVLYYVLGGREVRVVAAAGAVYYLVQKKVIETKKAEAKEAVTETVEEIRKRLFGR